MSTNGRGAHVNIATPIYESVGPKTLMCFMALQSHLYERPPPGLGRFGFRYWSQSGISFARQGLLVKAFEEGASHILWIDADMMFPFNVLDRLLAHNLPFVGANCVRRQEPYTWTAQDSNGKELSSVGKTGLEQAGYLGFGVTLMALECFRKIKPPFFLFDWVTDNAETGAGHFKGEDIYLCDKLAEVGIRPWIDHDLSREIKHVGRLEVDYHWAAGWREALPNGEILDPAVVR